MRSFRLASAALAVAIAATPVLAHHSFADYDDKRKMTVSGTLKEVRFTNPHIGLTVDVRAPNGKVDSWQFSGPSPADWRAAGWVKSEFVIGQQVTITGFPKRDGSQNLSINILKTQNGKVFGHEIK